MNALPVVPLSALEHHIYCPRQCALIHVDGVWEENRHTIRGTEGHARADSGYDRRERGVTVLRSVPLWSEILGLAGRSDIIEVSDRGDAVPVEYKIGILHGAAAHVQVCAQALCLEEMLQRPVPHGLIWVSSQRRRLRVAMDDDLRDLTLKTILATRRSFQADRLPAAVNDQRCGECQLRDHCQPELSANPGAIWSYMREVVGCVC